MGITDARSGGRPESATNHPPVVRLLLGYFVLGLLVTREVARNHAEVDTTRAQAGDARTQMVIADGPSDVELVDPHAVQFVLFHHHVAFICRQRRSPSFFPPARSKGARCHSGVRRR